MIHKISAQYLKACRRKVWKTVTDGRMDGRRPGRTDGHHHTITRPVWRRVYKNNQRSYYSFVLTADQVCIVTINWVTVLNTVWHIWDCMEKVLFNLLLIDFNNISWINSKIIKMLKLLYVVTYFKISTFVHTYYLGGNMHCKVLCIVHYGVGPRTYTQQIVVLWKPNYCENRTTVKTEL